MVERVVVGGLGLILTATNPGTVQPNNTLDQTRSVEL